MKRTGVMTIAVVLLALGGVASAQQFATRPAAPRTTRSYRSYSVTPAQRADARRQQQATWRDAAAKPSGHYATGR